MQFIDLQSWSSPMAVTLTFKKAIPSNNGEQRLTPERASRNLRHFLNVLKGKIYKNQRKHRWIKCFAVREVSADGRLHYHLTLDCPLTVSQQEMGHLVRLHWPRTHWGYKQLDIQPFADRGWLEYQLKLRSKPNFDESIDWFNCLLAELSG
jgi:hypothetical protein